MPLKSGLIQPTPPPPIRDRVKAPTEVNVKGKVIKYKNSKENYGPISRKAKLLFDLVCPSVTHSLSHTLSH